MRLSRKRLRISSSAFEGIGTIVAIESSMRSPRKYFPRLMALAIASVLVILCGFGTACYGYFGVDTKQAITLNLSDGSSLVVALWSFILVSILLTFPLQVFPIFLAVEDVWHVEHRVVFLMRRAAITAACTGNAGLLGVSALSCTLYRVGIAYTAQNSFAFVGAINGSVGCALLLFVIPCAIDLKLNAHATVPIPSPRIAFRWFFTVHQGSLLWWRCVLVALLGICGGSFSLKLAIQSIVAK